MNREQENGMVYITLIIYLIAMAVIMICCSCATRKEYHTEVITVHDTVQEVRTDTIRDVRIVTVHDSTHHYTERYITLKDSGDTLRIEVNNTIERIIQKSDSLDRYRHVVDSLKAVIDKAAKNDHNNIIQDTSKYIKYKILFYIAIIFITSIFVIRGFKAFMKNRK